MQPAVCIWSSMRCLRGWRVSARAGPPCPGLPPPSCSQAANSTQWLGAGLSLVCNEFCARFIWPLVPACGFHLDRLSEDHGDGPEVLY